MATAATNLSNESAEAVIISGPRKGEFITVSRTGEELATPDADALVVEMTTTAERITDSLQQMRRDAERFRTEMRARKNEHHVMLQNRPPSSPQENGSCP